MFIFNLFWDNKAFILFTNTDCVIKGTVLFGRKYLHWTESIHIRCHLPYHITCLFSLFVKKSCAADQTKAQLLFLMLRSSGGHLVNYWGMGEGLLNVVNYSCLRTIFM